MLLCSTFSVSANVVVGFNLKEKIKFIFFNDCFLSIDPVSKSKLLDSNSKLCLYKQRLMVKTLEINTNSPKLPRKKQQKKLVFLIQQTKDIKR